MKLSWLVVLAVFIAGCSAQNPGCQGDGCFDQGIKLAPLPPVNPESKLVPAVKANKIDLVKAALKGGEDPNQTQKTNFTSFQYACSFCDTEVVEVMLNAGGKLDSRETWIGRTPLMLAVDGSRPATVKLLIQAGADVNAVTPKGSSALGFALSRLALSLSDEKLKSERASAKEIVEILKAAGAKD